MSEQTKTTETCNHAIINTWAFSETGEPAKFWSCAQCKVKFVPITNELRLERERDAAREVLRELDEATSAAYPAFEAGADAQLAWSDRIDNARRCARSLLDEGAT